MINRIIAAAFGLLLLSADVWAQIDINDYFLLGRWSKWRFEQVDDSSDFRNVAVTSFKVIGPEVRYTVRLPDVGSLAFLYVTFSRSASGELVLHNMRVEDESFADFGSASPVIFDPPMFIGNTSTTLDLPPTVYDVHTSFDVKLKFGPLSKTVEVMVDGTFTVSLESTGDDVETLLDAPDDVIDANEIVLLRLVPFLTFSIDDDDLGQDSALLASPAVLQLAYQRGVVFLEEGFTFAARQLVKAILPGRALGPFEGNDDYTGFSFPIPTGVFTLNDAAAAATTGGAAVNKDGEDTGTLQLTEVTLQQELGGALVLEAMASFSGPDTGVGEQIPVTLKGKSKFSTKKGLAKFTLAGKTNVGKNKFSNLAKPLVIKAKASITKDSDSVELSFKSGKDALGTMQLAITPSTSSEAVVTLDGLVDTVFTPPKARPLGSEGFLTFGGSVWPISVLEKRITPKTKEGEEPAPDKRSYQLKHTGFGTLVAAFKALSTDTDISLTSFKGKFLGTPFKLLAPEDEVTTTDSFED